MEARTGAPQLRPLGIGEVLDAGFRLVRKRFGTLVLCAVAVAAPLSILDTLVTASTDDAAFDFTSGPKTPSQSDGEVLTGVGISRLISVLLVLLVLASCFRAISAAYLGEQATAGESLRFAFRRLPALFGAYLLITLTLIVGFVLLIIPGIYLGVALSMAFPALLFERLRPLRAYGRSFELVTGHWWRTFAILLLSLVIFAVISAALGGGLGAILGSAAPGNEGLAAVFVTVLNILLSVVLYPIAAGILTVLYYDLRVRKEGFDLELLARGVGSGAPPAPAESAPEWRAPSGWAPPQAPGGFTAPERPPAPPPEESAGGR
jgi:MFS family permease